VSVIATQGARTRTSWNRPSGIFYLGHGGGGHGILGQGGGGHGILAVDHCERELIISAFYVDRILDALFGFFCGIVVMLSLDLV
jgi:hypothetical protein